MAPQAGRMQLPGLSANSRRTTPGHTGVSDCGAVSAHKREKVAFGLSIKHKKQCV